jgi:DNA-binding transcriptional LysR family regulator
MDRIDQLGVFLAIVDSGSLAGAARQTGRSPPAVTRILNELEAQLGVRLAERTTRRLGPTDAGLRLAEHARRLLAEFEDAMRDTAGEAAAPRGRLRLSAPLTFGRMHLMPVVLAFLNAHPQVSAELSLEDRPVDLIEEGIDAALRIAHLPDSSLVARRLGTVRRIVVASPGYLRRRGRPKHPEDLVAHDIVLFANSASSPVWPFIAPGAGEQQVRVTARFQVNRAEAAIAAARDGQGVVRVLSYQVAEELRSGRLVRLLRDHETPPIPVQLVFPSVRLMAPRLRAFLDFAVPRLSGLAVLRQD